MTEIAGLVIALAAMAILALALTYKLWETEKRCEALDTKREALEAELKKTRSELTRCTDILARRLDELRAAKTREAETAAQVARIMGSTDAELGAYVVKISFCTALVDDYPAILHNMLEIAEQNIIAKWHERQRKTERRTEEFRARRRSGHDDAN